MPKAKKKNVEQVSPHMQLYRRLAWALMLAWTFGWGIVGVVPWLGIPDLAQDNPAIHLIPVGIGIAGGIATMRHPLAGGVYWLIAGFLLSSLIVFRIQSLEDVLIWCLAALPALVTGLLFIVNLTPEERAAVQKGRR